MMEEVVILADENGQPAGTENKLVVHTANTPLHFAFSAWLVRDGQVLLTRRALTKQTWPGVWTNSFCGHPAPGETNAEAVLRRAEFELGINQLTSKNHKKSCLISPTAPWIPLASWKMKFARSSSPPSNPVPSTNPTPRKLIPNSGSTSTK